MSDINFQPIFDYIDQAITPLREDIAALQSDMTDLKGSVANLSAQVKKYHEEMLVSGHRIDRLEEWAKQVGSKVGVPIAF